MSRCPRGHDLALPENQARDRETDELVCRACRKDPVGVLAREDARQEALADGERAYERTRGRVPPLPPPPRYQAAIDREEEVRKRAGRGRSPDDVERT